MNCLVVMPDFKYHSLVPYRFPLEPGYLSAVLKQTEGLNTKTLNLNDVEGDCLVGLLRAIRAGNAEIVLLYGSYTDYHCVRDAVAAIKKYDAAIKTVAFGGLITGDPLTVMRGMEQLDYGLIGEVERGGPKLCLALKRGEDPKNISGLVLRNGGGLEITGPPELASDLSSLPWCDYEGFGFGHYLDTRGVEAGNLFQSFPHRTLPIRTSRSCIGACTFCIRHIENRYRERNLDDVFNELDFLADKYDIQYILFMDEMLGRTPQRLEEICRRLKKYNLSGWHAEIRFDLMRPEAYEMPAARPWPPA